MGQLMAHIFRNGIDDIGAHGLFCVHVDMNHVISGLAKTSEFYVLHSATPFDQTWMALGGNPVNAGFQVLFKDI